jgi:hypothetical protein
VTSSRLSSILRSTHQPFPPIPQTAGDWVATGVRQRATFFGCDPVQTPAEYPMVIYLPNAPPITGDDPVTKCVFGCSLSVFRGLNLRQHGDVYFNLSVKTHAAVLRPSALQHDIRLHASALPLHLYNNPSNRLTLGQMLTLPIPTLASVSNARQLIAPVPKLHRSSLAPRYVPSVSSSIALIRKILQVNQSCRTGSWCSKTPRPKA